MFVLNEIWFFVPEVLSVHPWFSINQEPVTETGYYVLAGHRDAVFWKAGVRCYKGRKGLCARKLLNGMRFMQVFVQCFHAASLGNEVFDSGQGTVSDFFFGPSNLPRINNCASHHCICSHVQTQVWFVFQRCGFPVDRCLANSDTGATIPYWFPQKQWLCTSGTEQRGPLFCLQLTNFKKEENRYWNWALTNKTAVLH